MADKYPRVTEAELQRAQADRVKQVLVATSSAAAITGLYSLANAPGGFPARFIVKGFSGVEVRPQPGRSFGPGVATYPKASFPLALLPQPVGFVPAEFYGLKPNVVQDTLGFRMGSKPAILNPAQERITEFEARQAVEAILKRATTGPANQYSPTSQPYIVRPGPINITRGELDYLKALPPTLHPGLVAVPVIESRADDIIGGKNYRYESPQYGYASPAERLLARANRPTGVEVEVVTPQGTIIDALETAQGKILPVDSEGYVIGLPRPM